MTALLLFFTALLIALNAFFVMGEYSLVRSRRARLEALKKEGARGADLALKQVDEIGDYISAVQVGITMTSIGIGALGEPVLADLLEPLFGGPLSHGVAVAISVTVAYLLITSAHIVAGEMVPKLYVDRQGRGRGAAPGAAAALLPPALHAVHRGPHRASATGSCARCGVDPDVIARRAARPRSSRRSSPSPTPAASSTPARPGCSAASSTCTSRRRAR